MYVLWYDAVAGGSSRDVLAVADGATDDGGGAVSEVGVLGVGDGKNGARVGLGRGVGGGVVHRVWGSRWKVARVGSDRGHPFFPRVRES